ncbi:MAG: hypothetical protein Q8P41_02485 [Pseudomonadota bacterium]|nr:hypothetical protein [Pseudomonadota bacterium]
MRAVVERDLDAVRVDAHLVDDLVQELAALAGGAMQFVEVEQRARETVQAGGHDHVDLAAADGPEHLLKLRAVEVLAAGAVFAEDAGDELRALT